MYGTYWYQSKLSVTSGRPLRRVSATLPRCQAIGTTIRGCSGPILPTLTRRIDVPRTFPRLTNFKITRVFSTSLAGILHYLSLSMTITMLLLTVPDVRVGVNFPAKKKHPLPTISPKPRSPVSLPHITSPPKATTRPELQANGMVML